MLRITLFTYNKHTSPSDVAVPPDPLGFDVDYRWNTDLPLDPFSVYANAIKIIYALSQQPWDGPVKLADLDVTKTPGLNLVINLTKLPTSDRLEPAHLVLGLRQAVFDMAGRKPGFYRCMAFYAVWKLQIGRMIVMSDPDFSGSGEASKESIDLDALHFNSTLTATSGTITDPQDRHFTISWQYEGVGIPVDDIFTTIIDAQTAVAAHYSADECDQIIGQSVSTKTMFHITRLVGVKLRCGRIMRALILMSDVIFAYARYAEMGFVLKEFGVDVGRGVFYRIRPLALGRGDGTQ